MKRPVTIAIMVLAFSCYALAGGLGPSALRDQDQAAGTAGQVKPAFPRFSIRVGYVMGHSTATTSVSWTEAQYQETARYGVDYSAAKGGSLRIGFGYKFATAMGIELGVDFSSRTLGAANSASIPHPLYFNSPRIAEAGRSYRLKENAVFLNFQYGIPLGRLGLDLYAGPVLFMTSAEVTSAIPFTESAYPYDTVSITVLSEKIGRNVLGFNGGANLGLELSKGFALYLDARYSSAKADYVPTTGIPGTSLTLGGFRLGGGLKFVF